MFLILKANGESVWEAEPAGSRAHLLLPSAKVWPEAVCEKVSIWVFGDYLKTFFGTKKFWRRSSTQNSIGYTTARVSARNKKILPHTNRPSLPYKLDEISIRKFCMGSQKFYMGGAKVLYGGEKVLYGRLSAIRMGNFLENALYFETFPVGWWSQTQAISSMG